MKHIFSQLVSRAKGLRHRQTEVEKLLWSKLRSGQTGCKFRRQYPIGRYIADFVCLEKRLIVELDGGQHTEEKDRSRTEFLEREGFRVVRFWNDEVLRNMDSFFQIVMKELHASESPSP